MSTFWQPKLLCLLIATHFHPDPKEKDIVKVPRKIPRMYKNYAYEKWARQPFGLHPIILRICEKKYFYRERKEIREIKRRICFLTKQIIEIKCFSWPLAICLYSFFLKGNFLILGSAILWNIIIFASWCKRECSPSLNRNIMAFILFFSQNVSAM